MVFVACENGIYAIYVHHVFDANDYYYIICSTLLNDTMNNFELDYN